MNIAQHIERGRRLSPDKPALIFEGRSVTYATLDDMASRFANGLLGLRVKRGDRVALFLPNSPEWVVTYLGIQKIGAVAVSINPSLKSEEVELLLNDSGAQALIVTSALRELVPHEGGKQARHLLIADDAGERGMALSELIAQASPRAQAVEMRRDDPAAIVYTSGTTGLPKGAVLSHGNVTSNVEAKRRYLGIRPEDRLSLFLPLSHCFGQNAILNSGLGAGATVVLHSKFEPARVLRSVIDDGITMFFGVPTTYLILSDRACAHELDGVRYFFSAAATLPEEVERRWREKFGKVIYQGYGLTETSPFASYNHHLKHKPASIGTPIEAVEMRIVSVDDGSELPPGELGEIVVRGPNVMLGYWNRPGETAQAIRDGWFHTGDLGRQDGEGYFYLEDRLKDVINVGGLKVFPAEVENLIYQHPATAEVAVYGLPDTLMGERVVASIVVKPGRLATAAEIVAFCRGRIADYKVPDAVEFVEAIPKNPTGKVLKRVLREKASSAAGSVTLRDSSPAGPARTSGSIQPWLTEWLAGRLGIAAGSVDVDQSFFDYGLSSIAAVKLAEELGHWLGRPLAATIAWNFPTIGSLAGHLADEARRAPATAPADPEPRAISPSPGPRASEIAENLEGLSAAEIAGLLSAEIAATKGRKSR